MSSQKGNTKRTRPQKHQNRSAFKNNLHDKTRQIQLINDLVVSGVCAHCKDVIDWKIKYKKYKALNYPKTCVKCHQKNVMSAYYIMCQECATSQECCAKCGEKSEIMLQPAASKAESSSKEAEFQKELKSLSEKKRRKFLRLLGEGKLTMEEIKSGKRRLDGDDKDEDLQEDDNTESDIAGADNFDLGEIVSEGSNSKKTELAGAGL